MWAYFLRARLKTYGSLGAENSIYMVVGPSHSASFVVMDHGYLPHRRLKIYGNLGAENSIRSSAEPFRCFCRHGSPAPSIAVLPDGVLQISRMSSEQKNPKTIKK